MEFDTQQSGLIKSEGIRTEVIKFTLLLKRGANNIKLPQNKR